MVQPAVQEARLARPCGGLLSVGFTIQPTAQGNPFDPQRWGLSDEAIAQLPNRLRRCWERFRCSFQTKTYDFSKYAWVYLRGLLLMETKGN